MFAVRKVLFNLKGQQNEMLKSLIHTSLTKSAVRSLKQPFSLRLNHYQTQGNVGQKLSSHENELNFHGGPESENLKHFFTKVNDTISATSKERHFAVVYAYSKQKLVTEGDMFYVYKDLPANLGDRIKLEKILLVGNDSLTLIGRPLLDRNLVHVEATVIEKTHSHTFMGLKAFKRSHCFRRYYFQRKPLTILRINEIKICHNLNEAHSVLQ